MNLSFLKSKLARRAFFVAVLSALTPLGALTFLYPHFLGTSPLSSGIPAEKIILLLTLLSMCMALLLSVGLARRSLSTLRKLQAATQTIQNMDFNVRIDTFGNDDFDELANSLSLMATRLEQEFDALRTVEFINTKILSSLDKAAATATLLARLQNVLPGDGLIICMAEESPRRCLKIFVQGEELLVTDPIEKRALNQDEIEELRQSPSGVILREDANPPYYLQPLREYGAKRFLLFPVFVHNDLTAIFAFGFKDDSPIHGRFVPRARQIADEYGMALSNIRLIEELDDLNWGTMTALARVVDAKSPWTAGHSERVTTLSLKIGRMLGMSERALKSMHQGALLHDIGKVGVPVRVLDKPGKLTPEERDLIEKHVEVGQHILEPIPSYHDLVPMVRQHHESFDGTGYPDKLAGKDIDFRARILAVADVFDAFTHDRPYRKSLGREAAVAWIWQMSGKKFDPRVVDAFLLIMNQEAKETQNASSPEVIEAGMDDPRQTEDASIKNAPAGASASGPASAPAEKASSCP